jgi:hypothetical protein
MKLESLPPKLRIVGSVFVNSIPTTYGMLRFGFCIVDRASRASTPTPTLSSKGCRSPPKVVFEKVSCCSPPKDGEVFQTIANERKISTGVLIYEKIIDLTKRLLIAKMLNDWVLNLKMLLVYRKKAMLIQIEESCPITKKK